MFSKTDQIIQNGKLALAGMVACLSSCVAPAPSEMAPAERAAVPPSNEVSTPEKDPPNINDLLKRLNSGFDNFNARSMGEIKGMGETLPELGVKSSSSKVK